MTTRPTVAIGVVVIPQRLDLLRGILEDVRTQTESPAEILVVIQGQDATPLHLDVTDAFAELPVRLIGNRELSVGSGRNLLLRDTRADVLMFMDDDSRMPPDAVRVVSDAFAQRSDAAAVTFKARWTGEGERVTNYPDEPMRRTTWRSFSDIVTFEIAISLAKVRSLGVTFDPLFGRGGRFGTGGEFLLLLDILEAGGPIHYVPTEISAHPARTSGSKLDEEMLIAKGALFARAFGLRGLPAGWVFAVRKVRSGRSSSGLVRALKATTRGWRAYPASRR